MSAGTGAIDIVRKPTPRNRPNRSARKPSKPRKLDRDAARAMHEAGHSMPDIANRLGVACSTVYRFLDKATPEHAALEAFKANRANVFADLQNKAIKLQIDIIDSFYVDGVPVALTPQQKVGLLGSLNAVSGTIYDKERLELGKSTSNVGVLQRIMGSALSEAHKAEEDKPEPTPIEAKR